MYESFFKLKKRPFSNTYQSDFLYLNEYNRLVLKSFIDELDLISIKVITGEAGVGKTSLIKKFIQSLPQQIKTIQITYTAHDEHDFIRFIALELGPEVGFSKSSIVNTIESMAAEYVRVLLIVDDADKLGKGPLRLLFDLTETLIGRNCPFNLFLIGLPELKTMLLQEGYVERFQNKMSISFIPTLHEEELETYIQHRLLIAGADDIDIFLKETLPQIYNFSGGIPRVINMICDTALLNAYLMNERKVNEEIIKRTIEDLSLDEDFRLATLKHSEQILPESKEEKIANESVDVDMKEPDEMVKEVVKEEVSIPEANIVKEMHSTVLDDEDDKKDVLPVEILVLDNNARMRMHYENYFTQKKVSFKIFKELNALFSYLHDSRDLYLNLLIVDASYFFIKGGLESPEGMKALDILLKEFSYLPVIVTSSLPLSSIRNKLLHKGLAYFVAKPDLSEIDLSEVKLRLSQFFKEIDKFRGLIERQFQSFYRKIISNLKNTGTQKTKRHN